MNKIYLWLTDPIRDKDSTLSVSRLIKCGAAILTFYGGIQLVKTDPLSAVIVFASIALGQPVASALASKINPNKDFS